MLGSHPLQVFYQACIFSLLPSSVLDLMVHLCLYLLFFSPLFLANTPAFTYLFELISQRHSLKYFFSKVLLFILSTRKAALEF